MDVLLTIAGIALIVVAARDIFETLFHPTGRGVLGGRIVRGVWAAFGRSPRRTGTTTALAGPLAYIAVLGAWTGMLVLGWALVFLPHLPDGFSFDPGLDPAEHESLVDAIYVSLVNLTSLGYGDITPEAAALRLLGPIETAFGLGLLTASISWLISIYSCLSRRDSFAHEVHLSRVAERTLDEKLADADPRLLERMLTSFADQLITVRRDLIHFPITYYFRSEDEQLVLSELLPFLRRLIQEASEPGRPHALRVRAEILRLAVNDYEAVLRDL
jgi:voltage-gated potassium channel Kch